MRNSVLISCVPCTLCACRDGSAREVVIGVFLAMLSAALGYALLASGYYTDFSVFVMCFIIGSAHYSLLKVSDNVCACLQETG